MSTSKFTVNPNSKKTQIVGILPQKILDHFNIQCPSAEVKIFPGAIKHIKKRHPGIFEQYYELIPNIIESPDYVGQNPREPSTSVELIKVVSEHLLLAVKLDPSGYLYVSTLYDLNNGMIKVQKRLKSGRLIPFNQL